MILTEISTNPEQIYKQTFKYTNTMENTMYHGSCVLQYLQNASVRKNGLYTKGEMKHANTATTLKISVQTNATYNNIILRFDFAVSLLGVAMFVIDKW